MVAATNNTEAWVPGQQRAQSVCACAGQRRWWHDGARLEVKAMVVVFAELKNMVG
jgi:hypothetical protein